LLERLVSLGGDENDRDFDTGIVQMLVKIDAAESGQIDVEYQAVVLFEAPGIEEFLSRGIRTDVETFRAQGAAQHARHRSIIVHN